MASQYLAPDVLHKRPCSSRIQLYTPMATSQERGKLRPMAGFPSPAPPPLTGMSVRELTHSVPHMPDSLSRQGSRA